MAEAQRAQDALDHSELINKYNSLRTQFPDLIILNLTDSSNNQRIVFYSQSKNQIIDPSREKENTYSPISFYNTFKYEYKQYGSIHDGKIVFGAKVKANVLSQIPRKITSSRDMIVNEILRFNRQRGIVPIDRETAEKILEVAEKWAKVRKLDLALVLAVIWQESGFSVNVKSGRGNSECFGLMQVNERNYNGKSSDLYDIERNIELGTLILAENKKRYGLRNGLAAYNGGPKGIRFKICQKYASDVLEKYDVMRKLLES
ncbi:MAG: lytic transglycosylase domain-containing protein [Candidatus Micrarchaeota archaeon]|nr:lytic transglycosylase domain-containing protein [Candidatus Micrarchaeota archaeon]